MSTSGIIVLTKTKEANKILQGQFIKRTVKKRYVALLSGKLSNQTRVHFYPITGRTHQLRVHAAHKEGLNTPIKGDDLYGNKQDRLYLHAEFIEFTHPTSRNKISFTVPADF